MGGFYLNAEQKLAVETIDKPVLVMGPPGTGKTHVLAERTARLLDAGHPRAALLGPATLIAVEARPRADTTSRVLAVRALDADGGLTPWTLLGANVETGWIAGLGPDAALACWSERREGRSREIGRASCRERV